MAYYPVWLAQGIPVHFMDLPMSMQFQMEEDKKGQLKMPCPLPKNEVPIVRDPMGILPSLLVFGQRALVEVTFEQPDHESDIFASIIDLNTTLRDELYRQESRHNRTREAYMRKTLRDTSCPKATSGYTSSVAPGTLGALHHLARFTPKKDNALLKGSEKEATWIPWSYQRLYFSKRLSGRRISPVRYSQLFSRCRRSATVDGAG